MTDLTTIQNWFNVISITYIILASTITFIGSLMLKSFRNHNLRIKIVSALILSIFGVFIWQIILMTVLIVSAQNTGIVKRGLHGK